MQNYGSTSLHIFIQIVLYEQRSCICGLILKVFGQMHSAIGQMRAHLTNFVRIWSLLVGLTKCAAHLGKRAAQLAKCERNLPNVAHLVKCRAFDQLVKCAAHLAKCGDLSNAPYINTFWSDQDIMFDYTAQLTGIGDRSEFISEN